MEASCVWLVLCEKAVQDTFSGTLSIFTCLEKIRALEFPTEHPNFMMVAQLRSDTPPTETLPVHFRVVRWSKTDGESIVQEFNGRWQADKKRSRVVVGFRGVRLLREETIWFRIDWQFGDEAWQTGRASPLDVEQFTAQEAEEIQKAMATPPQETDAMPHG